MAVKLSVVLGPEAGLNLRVVKDEVVIGRGADVDLRLSSPGKRVSRRHARVFKKDNTWLAEDLSSQNGTLLDGRPLDGTPQPVPFGAVLRVGEYAILFEAEPEPAVPVAVPEPDGLVGPLRSRAPAEGSSDSGPHPQLDSGSNPPFEVTRPKPIAEGDSIREVAPEPDDESAAPAPAVAAADKPVTAKPEADKAAADKPAEPVNPPSGQNAGRPSRPFISRRRWRLLVDSFQRAVAAADPDIAFGKLIRGPLAEMGALRAGLLLVNEDGGFTAGPSYRTDTGTSEIVLHVGPARQALQERGGLSAGPPIKGGHKEKESQGPAMQHLWTPVLLKGRPLGVLQVDRPAAAPEGADAYDVDADLDFLAGLADVIAAALENIRIRRSLRQEVRELRLAAATGHPIIGHSPALKKVLASAERVAATDAHMLITGEPGVGKELLAARIHFRGPRADKPFQRLSCIRRSPGLIECELFGYEDAGSSGGRTERLGKLELAAGGTLYLERIEDLPEPLQAKLLKVLDTRTVERVGGRGPSPVDVRVIASAECDMDEAVKAGKFRVDLYDRLAALTLRVPPLRERAEDVAELVSYYLAHFADAVGRAAPALSEQLRVQLEHYAWPGNIRQLRNAMEKLTLLCDSQVITLKDWETYLPEAADWESPTNVDLRAAHLDDESTSNGPDGPPGGREPRERDREPAPVNVRRAFDLEETEKRQILLALQHTRHSPSEAAKLLGIARGTLYRKMERYGIRPARDG